jgi:alpha-galactosidase
MTFAADGLPKGLSLDEKTGFITGKCDQRGSSKVKLTATNSHGLASAVLNIEIGDQICLTPPLGWNSWNKFAGKVTEADVRGAADAMVNSGLINHDWTYINIDDTWEIKPGSNDPVYSGPARDEQGHILTNKEFPDMKALGDSIHAKGLKFGIYSSPGPQTCARFETSYQHEDLDAQSYGEWGVDYEHVQQRRSARRQSGFARQARLAREEGWRHRSLGQADGGWHDGGCAVQSWRGECVGICDME